MIFFFFFFNDTATTEIYTLSLHDALPIFAGRCRRGERSREPRFAGQYNLSLSLLPEYAVAGRVPKGGRNARSPRGHASGVFSGRRARQRDAGRAAALRGCRAAAARCAGGRNGRAEIGRAHV